MATQNALFAIVDLSDPSATEAKLPSLAPWPYKKLRNGAWLLVAPAPTTTQEVTEKLGFAAAGTSTSLILRVENYYGRNYEELWEWIKTKKGAEIDSPSPA